MARLNRTANWSTDKLVALGKLMKRVANAKHEEDGGSLEDLKLRTEFIQDPINVLNRVGITVNEGQNVVVVEDSVTTIHIIIPEAIPDDAQHPDEHTGAVTIMGCR